MKNQRWLDALRAELIKQGLPKRYIRRLMKELADHTLDLMEEQEMDDRKNDCAAMENHLGKPQELAEAAVANYRAAKFVGRHPWLTFLVAPVPVMVLTWIGFVLIGGGLLNALPSILGDAYDVEGKAASEWLPLLIWMVRAFDYTLRFVPSAAVVVVFCYLVRRSGRSFRWALAACGLVAVLSAGVQTQLTLSDVPGESAYRVAFGLPLGLSIPSMTTIVQFAIPLAIALILGLRHVRYRRQLELT